MAHLTLSVATLCQDGQVGLQRVSQGNELCTRLARTVKQSWTIGEGQTRPRKRPLLHKGHDSVKITEKNQTKNITSIHLLEREEMSKQIYEEKQSTIFNF